jgi:hypothetical protein
MDDGHTGLQLSPDERPFLSLLIGLVPAPVDLVFDSTPYKEYGKHKWHTDENDALSGYPTHDANAGGEPSAGCRCQSMDVFAQPAASPKDHARSEKADPSQDALDDFAYARNNRPCRS